jgi:hypothetical protein
VSREPAARLFDDRDAHRRTHRSACSASPHRVAIAEAPRQIAIARRRVNRDVVVAR